MLSSNGFFKTIFCPYEKAQLCHRPYCHYRHANSDSIKNVCEERDYLFNPANSKYHQPVSHQPIYKEDTFYFPTNVNQYDNRPVGILKSSNPANQPSTSNFPVYNPTPISKLKELNNPQVQFRRKNAYDPEYPFQFKKKKKTEEYDPTEVKHTSKMTKKNVSFDPSIPDDPETEPITYISDDESYDSADAPKFSDDDEIENESQKITSQKNDVSENPLPNDKTINSDEESDVDEKKIDEFSIVDKIIVDSKKTEKMIAKFKKSALMNKSSEKSKDKNKSDISIKKSNKDKSKKGNGILKSIDKNCNKSETDKKKSKSDKNVEKTFELINKDIYDSSGFDRNDVYNCDFEESSSVSETSSKKEIPDLQHKNLDNKIIKLSEKCDDNLKSNKLKKSSKVDQKEKIVKNSNDLKTSKNKVLSKNDKKNYDTKKSSNSSVSVNKVTKSDLSKKSNTSEKGKSHKSSSSSLTKSDKSASESSIKTKKLKYMSTKESVKLQDEKVTSSSIIQKAMLEQSTKHSKPKSIVYDKNDSNPSTSKRKSLDSDCESQYKSTSKKKKTFMPHKESHRENEKDSDDSFDDSIEQIALSSDESDDTNAECLRIFQETFPEKEKSPVNKKNDLSEKKLESQELNILRKNRVAHAASLSGKKSSTASKSNVKTILNPGQVMLNRFAQLKARHQSENESQAKELNSNLTGPVLERRRICASSNSSLMAALAEKHNLKQNDSSFKEFTPLPSTVTKTLKVTKRVAHIPEVAVKPRPIIPSDYGSKVPTVLRQKYLNAFIEEYLKFSASEDEAYDNSMEEEKNAYQRSSSKAIYINVACNALSRLRHKSADASRDKKPTGVCSASKSSTKTVSHEMVLNGPLAQRTSYSIERKKTPPIPELKGKLLYDYLADYILPEVQLKENGFPMPHPSEVGRAVIEGIYANRTRFCNDPFKRTCCRCQKVYYVNVDGNYVRDEECDFHWGRLWKRRIAGTFESRYSCCQGDSESDGCCVGTGHVYEGSEAHALKGFVKTLPKTPPPDDYYGVYALDCEMCYTTAGIELTRVSVIGPDCKPVYETFVRPHNKVLDYNTRFSGITEDDLKSVRTTIRDVQAVLLCMFNSRTVLIGHSLESDFKALKLFHKTVVDTSVVFPHKLGLPFKRALRTLMGEKLNKIIQNDVGGHDSAEDAVSCMELMIWKIKEDLKGNR